MNSYIYGDARAIERIAALGGKTELSAEFAQKATDQRERIEKMLWNPKDQFYEVLAPAADPGIRRQVK